MFKFPAVVEVEAAGKLVKFSITEIRHNVFAIKHHLHSMQNADELTFGYILYKEGYLYASCVSPDDSHPQKVVFACYVGADDCSLGDEQIDHLFKSIAIAVVQLSQYENKHPAIVDRESFFEIFDTLLVGIQSSALRPNTPFIQSVYEMAVDLRDFYSNMVERLEAIKPDENESA